MEEISLNHFYEDLVNNKQRLPLTGLIELTYRCNLSCVHCYCKGSEREGKELTTNEWKNILDIIQKEGCVYLTLSGGEPLLRNDFLEIYSYAKRKGFIITLFTNAQAITEEIINSLVKEPPFLVGITLNGITKKTYESITQTAGSFSKAMQSIKKLVEKKIKLILKTNCLKQNKYEVGRIKAFCEELLGRPSLNAHHFKYDPMIFPRLNGDKTPCNYRLSFEEILEIKKQDKDIWNEYQRSICHSPPDLERDKDFLYMCNSWLNSFFINPYGLLKFCQFSDKFSIDLNNSPFKNGFYNWQSKILSERFKADSKCKTCDLRAVCYYCPARASLETGNEEKPVEYYCKLAQETAKQIEEAKTNK